MATEGSFARTYLIAQLEQIEAALERLDELPGDQADRLGRQELLRLASDLLTVLGGSAGSPTPTGLPRATTGTCSESDEGGA